MRRAAGSLKSRYSKSRIKTELECSSLEDKRWHRFERDAKIAKGLDDFCTEFMDSIQQQVKLFMKLWDLMQGDVLNTDWFEEDDGLLATHVWALRTGLDEITGKVRNHVQKVAKRVKKIVDQFEKFGSSENFEGWNKAWVGKEHYERKLKQLRAELTQYSQAGKSLTTEQMERLRRNEEKTIEAQDHFETFHLQSSEYQSARGVLKDSLRDVVRTVTCGWFIATGATICTAVHEAEAAHREASAEGFAAEATTASAASQPKEGRLSISNGPETPSSPVRVHLKPYSQETIGWALPTRTEDADMARIGEKDSYDPDNPFKSEWDCAGLGIESGDEVPDGSTDVELRPGIPVMIHGLKNATELNSCTGVCEGREGVGRRWNVRFSDGSVKALPPQNISPCTSKERVASEQPRNAFPPRHEAIRSSSSSGVANVSSAVSPMVLPVDIEQLKNSRNRSRKVERAGSDALDTTWRGSETWPPGSDLPPRACSDWSSEGAFSERTSPWGAATGSGRSAPNSPALATQSVVTSPVSIVQQAPSTTIAWPSNVHSQVNESAGQSPLQPPLLHVIGASWPPKGQEVHATSPTNPWHYTSDSTRGAAWTAFGQPT